MKASTTRSILAGVVLIGLVLNAANAAASCTQKSCAGAVTRLIVVEHELRISLDDGADFGSLDCTPRTDGYLVLPLEHATFAESYSLLMAGLLSGNVTRVRIVEGTSPCEVSYVTIDG